MIAEGAGSRVNGLLMGRSRRLVFSLGRWGVRRVFDPSIYSLSLYIYFLYDIVKPI